MNWRPWPVRGCLERSPFLDKSQIDDVIIGCAFPEVEQGWNIARTIAVRSGLPNQVPAMTVNRFCSSGLQAIALAAAEINSGWSEVVVAGGVESMSAIPLGGLKQAPNPYLVEHYPEYYLSMGLTAGRGRRALRRFPRSAGRVCLEELHPGGGQLP